MLLSRVTYKRTSRINSNAFITNIASIQKEEYQGPIDSPQEVAGKVA